MTDRRSSNWFRRTMWGMDAWRAEASRGCHKLGTIIAFKDWLQSVGAFRIERNADNDNARQTS